MSQTDLAPPVVIPWDDVETLVKAGLSVQQIVDRMGIPDEFQRVKKQVTRKGWIKQSPAAIVNTATTTLTSAKKEHVPNVPTAQDILSQLGPDTRAKLSVAVNRASGRLAELEPDEVIERADKLKSIVSSADTLHGWREQAGSVQAVINIAFLGPTQDRPAIEQQGA